MALFVKAARQEQELKWAWIWFKQLAAFHGQSGDRRWRFSVEQTIAFLRMKRDTGKPAWKRMRIIEALIVFRQRVQQGSSDDLLPLKRKMAEIIPRRTLA